MNPLGAIAAWGRQHATESLRSLGRLRSSPASSLLTATVIGIALALPTGLSVLVDNARALSGAWDSALRMSVFLQHGSEPSTVDALAAELRAEAVIAEVEVILPERALAEFRERSGFGDALDLLEGNPLPPVLVVQPAAADPVALRALAERVGADPRVDQVVLDSRWLERFQTMISLVHRGLDMVALLLALAVIIIIGNTIRLDIQNHRQEIEVVKLVGGSDAFIRRPFLYTGLWYGAVGGLLAFVMVTVALWALAGPVARLAGLYGSGYALSGPGVLGLLLLLATGAGLGLAGSWLAVGRHIRDIEPE